MDEIKLKALRQSIANIAMELDEMITLIGDKYPIILQDQTAADEFAEQRGAPTEY